MKGKQYRILQDIHYSDAEGLVSRDTAIRKNIQVELVPTYEKGLVFIWNEEDDGRHEVDCAYTTGGFDADQNEMWLDLGIYKEFLDDPTVCQQI